MTPAMLDVVKVVGDYYGIPVIELLGQRRHRSVSRPRQVAYWVVRAVCQKSFPMIGRKLGRDHSTVLYGVRRISELVTVDDTLAKQVREIVDLVGKGEQ